MPSFEQINYNIRPNKSIERKMIVEVAQKLSYLNDIKDYRYIGFGSTYFTDFVLFHKHLGLNKMISIEKEKSKKDRVEFNKPFSCIEVEYGNATTILPNLELDKHHNIIWLDYDGKLEEYVFSDLDSVVSNSLAGTMFLMSVNIEPDPGDKEDRIKSLISRVGRQRIPVEDIDKNMNNANYALVVYKMIDRQIKKTILERTGGDSSILEYTQLFHYAYRDGAHMLTVGGLLLNEQQRRHLKKMKFEEIYHCSQNETPHKIQCPNLTYKEVHHLNRLLPCHLDISASGNLKNREFKKTPLNASDIKNFAEVYRYYPNFAEANI